MRLPSLFFLIMFLLMPGAVLGAVVLDVTITDGGQGRPDAAGATAGTAMDKEVFAAVLARLRIYQQQKDPKLTVGEMHRLHRAAEKDIKSALEPLGYYSPTVEAALVETEGVWHATYIITSGKPVLVRSISVEITGPGGGLSLFSDLEKQFPLQEGAVLNHQLYEEGKNKILRWAIQNGFVEAGFDKKEVRVHRGNHQADIDLLLNTGHRFLFGMTYSAQKIINQDLLSRYLPYKEGDPYSLRGISQLQSILYETGFFSGVTVEPEFDKVSELRVPVALTLVPSLRNRYSLGLGYGTDTGIRGKAEWRNRLFNDRGHRVSSSLQFSEKINRVGAAYEIPVADPRYDALKYAGNWASEKWEDTQTDLLSAAAAVSHTGPIYQYGASLEVRDEQYNVGVTSGSSLLLLPGGSWSAVFAENRINTEDGWRFFVEVKGADKNIISDATFVQAQAGMKAIASVFDKWRLIGRFTLGGTAVDSIDELPPSLRFYAGGDQSVRGYAYKSIGTTDASGTVIGGRYLLVGSMEVERKINDMWSVAAFYDTGQAMDTLNVDLKKSVGIGGRVALPFGQIRLDIAMPLLEEEHAFRIHLNIGADL